VRMPMQYILEGCGHSWLFLFLANNVGLTPFLEDKCDQYLLLTNTFVQNFHFYARIETPTVSFHLFDIPQEMTLARFCQVCKIPNEGNPLEPHPRDVEEFISAVTVGETRGVSGVRVASLHFPICVTFHYLPGGV
jgi:hypothetical protein